ncbi:MAG: hypothetical protein WA584_21255 [Pyrinomonadaceae bacterium]
MDKKKLTIKGITFPDFGDDDSKKNFRLIFYIAYTDEKGNDVLITAPKPAQGHWQWKKSSKDAFIPTKIVGNSAELNVSVLTTGDGNKIPVGSNKIAEVDGDITAITVDFMDVHDKTAFDVFVKSVLPQLIEVWKASGFDPIDFVPGAPIIKGILKKTFSTEDAVNKAKEFFEKQLKDKNLHTLSQEYNGENPFILKEENVVWDKKKNKSGTYAVTIGIA